MSAKKTPAPAPRAARQKCRQSLLSAAGLVSRKKAFPLLPAGIDAAAWIDAAIREGLGGMMYRALCTSGDIHLLDSHHRKNLRTVYYFNLQHNLKLLYDLKQILAETNRSRLRLVALQGIDLLLTVYDDPGQRPLFDIDLWVLKEDYRALTGLLNRLGYQTDPHYPLTFRKGATVIDLHRHLLWADRINARKVMLNIDPNQIYQNTRDIDVDGATVRCLAPSDRFIYLSLHLLKHNAERLIWLADIQRMVAGWSDADWKILIARAETLGQSKSVAYMCFLMQSCLGVHLPPSAAASFSLLNPLEKSILRRRAAHASLPVWSSLIFFSSGRGIRKGFAVIMETLFPRPDILRQIFPDDENPRIFALYLKRLRQLLGMLNTP